MESTKRIGKTVLIAIAVVLACIAIILAAVWAYVSYSPQRSEDPDWYDTHVKCATQAEAIETFGTDLLLDKTVLPDSAGVVAATEYELTFHGGDAENRENWDQIVCTMDYGRGNGTERKGYVYITISLSEDSQQDFLDQFTATQTVHGIAVGYLDRDGEQIGRFVYNGICYEVYGDNVQLVADTVEQMLSDV